MGAAFSSQFADTDGQFTLFERCSILSAMEIHELQSLALLAETGSLRGTAERCGLTRLNDLPQHPRAESLAAERGGDGEVVQVPEVAPGEVIRDGEAGYFAVEQQDVRPGATTGRSGACKRCDVAPGPFPRGFKGVAIKPDDRCKLVGREQGKRLKLHIAGATPSGSGGTPKV